MIYVIVYNYLLYHIIDYLEKIILLEIFYNE